MAFLTVPVSTAPIVTVFVRHSADCPRKGDEFHKGCKCPKHLRWSHGGKQFRQSAKTRSFTAAERIKREVEDRFLSQQTANVDGDIKVEAIASPTIERAIDLYVSDKKSQGLTPQILKKYERELGRFSDFMAGRSKLFPREVGLEDLTEYRTGWEEQYPSSTTRSKVQERLRGFLRYCYEAKLIDRVPKLSSIKIDEPPTLPLTPHEYEKLLAVILKEFQGQPVKAKRAHAIVRLMRFSGLAIRDSVTLERSELHWDNKRKLYRVTTARTKTGTHVSVLLPPDVSAEIKDVMALNANPTYVFWNTGTGKPQTAVTNWQHDLRQAFRAAGMKEGHPHQLRDTFAVWLLQRGVPLEDVSKALGHESIKTTERYYAKWIKGRQDRLDELVMSSWE